MNVSRLVLVLLSLCLVSPAFAKEDHNEFLLQNAAGSAIDGRAISVEAFSTVAMDLTFTGTATITFEGSVSGTSWTAIPCTNRATAVSATTATATGIYQCDVSGLTTFRTRISAFTDGLVTSYARATTATGGGGGGSGSSSLTSIGTAAAAAPTLVEGAAALFSFDTVGGGARVEETKLKYGEDVTRNLQMTGSGLSGQPVIATAMVVAGDGVFKTAQPGYNGPKSLQGRLTGTGAITQVMTIYGGFNSAMTTTNSEPLCVITLSGTTETSATCAPVTANFTQIGVVTSGTTGTGASGELIMGIP